MGNLSSNPLCEKCLHSHGQGHFKYCIKCDQCIKYLIEWPHYPPNARYKWPLHCAKCNTHCGTNLIGGALHDYCEICKICCKWNHTHCDKCKCDKSHADDCDLYKEIHCHTCAVCHIRNKGDQYCEVCKQCRPEHTHCKQCNVGYIGDSHCDQCVKCHNQKKNTSYCEVCKACVPENFKHILTHK